MELVLRGRRSNKRPSCLQDGRHRLACGQEDRNYDDKPIMPFFSAKSSRPTASQPKEIILAGSAQEKRQENDINSRTTSVANRVIEYSYHHPKPKPFSSKHWIGTGHRKHALRGSGGNRARNQKEEPLRADLPDFAGQRGLWLSASSQPAQTRGLRDLAGHFALSTPLFRLADQAFARDAR